MEACPICKQALAAAKNAGDYGNRVFVNCPVCGMFGITRSALKAFDQIVARRPAIRFVVSNHIRKALSSSDREPLDTPVFDMPQFGAILDFIETPTLREQANNFVRWLGDKLRDDPGATIDLRLHEAASIMAAGSEVSAGRLIQHLLDSGIVSGELLVGGCQTGLTFAGWDQYDEMQRSYSEGAIAFMAMPFGVVELDKTFLECFKPAVRQCGFDLRRIDEKPPAGLIDNRLRVEIRRSRFLIVDLTNDNRGAYWEAGFAEGLGKPVIYTCEAGYFEKSGTHFDTNHHQTIVWKPEHLHEAAARLKDTIRATLPAEARMVD